MTVGKIISINLTVLILGFAEPAEANTRKYNLFDLGCPTAFSHNSQYWTSDFDLGVTFTEITNVYIDWSGEITAGLAIRYTDPCNPFPQEVGIRASLGANPWPRLTEVWGGEETYPSPELFDETSKFSLSQTSSWSDLLNGQGVIRIQYQELAMLNGRYVESGLVMLGDATLIVEGTVIPEPATTFLLLFGVLMVKARHFRTSR